MAITAPETWDWQKRQQFQQSLLEWYDRHKRDLPWRQDRDSYRVWVSEIMLQQTRVNAVLEHYRRFLQLFPTVEKLARARESTVLSAWSGLGYYRRARMMHRAAKEIVKFLKENKLKKVQASIQGDQVRVTSASKDDLQEAMRILRGHDFGVALQFGNYR